ncbi:hypothetical protein ACFUN8_06030 [Streptomyces sp. NPDC057307]|uniref:hypothetical protein n=1 Tax=Streptomyces sp. NPDC057307 TaxID=3346096 RepID=UPI003626B57B
MHLRDHTPRRTRHLRTAAAALAGATYRLTAWVKNSGNIEHGWLGARTARGTVINEISHGGSPDWTRFVLTVKPGTATQLSL